jgi:hypothetical protein
MNDMIIKALEKRLDRLEKTVFGKKAKPAPEAGAEKFSGASGGVRFLISKNFFNTKRTLGETRSALAENGYHYSVQAVEAALRRRTSRRGPLTVLKEGGKNMYVIRK